MYIVESPVSCVRIQLCILPSQIEQCRGIHSHDNTTCFRLLHSIPHAFNVVGSVRKTYHVNSRRHVQAIMCVEVSTKHPAIKSLQSNDHSIGSLLVRQPYRDCCFIEHVRTAVQILGVRDFHYWKEPQLRVAHRCTYQGRFIRREISNFTLMLGSQPVRYQVISSMRHIFPDIHCLGIFSQDFVVKPRHVLAHYVLELCATTFICFQVCSAGIRH